MTMLLKFFCNFMRLLCGCPHTVGTCVFLPLMSWLLGWVPECSLRYWFITTERWWMDKEWNWNFYCFNTPFFSCERIHLAFIVSKKAQKPQNYCFLENKGSKRFLSPCNRREIFGSSWKYPKSHSLQWTLLPESCILLYIQQQTNNCALELKKINFYTTSDQLSQVENLKEAAEL